MLMALFVMSPKGVLSRCCGSGDMDGAGVGIGGGNSGTTDVLLPRAVLCLFLGDALFDGDKDASVGAMLSSGSNICDGSISSPVFTLLERVLLFGVAGTSNVVFLLAAVFRGLLFGAGVNSSSSSSSSWPALLGASNSSSDSSMMTFLLAALRVGRVGDIVAILWDLVNDGSGLMVVNRNNVRTRAMYSINKVPDWGKRIILSPNISMWRSFCVWLMGEHHCLEIDRHHRTTDSNLRCSSFAC